MKRPILLVSFLLNHASTAEQIPYYYWYSDGEEIAETVNGVVPTLSCPLGRYRDFGDKHLRRKGGIRAEGCIKCPPGRYGSSTRLDSSLCTGACPVGTYLGMHIDKTYWQRIDTVLIDTFQALRYLHFHHYCTARFLVIFERREGWKVCI